MSGVSASATSPRPAMRQCSPPPITRYLVESYRRVIGAFIETIRNRKGLSPSRPCRYLGKPVVALRSGAAKARPALRADPPAVGRRPGSVSALLHPPRDRVADWSDAEVLAAPGDRSVAASGHPRPGGWRADPRHRRAGRRRCRRCPRRRGRISSPSATFRRRQPARRLGQRRSQPTCHALRLFDASPDHDIVVFCRDRRGPALRDARLGADLSRPLHKGGSRQQETALPAAHATGIMDREAIARMRHTGSRGRRTTRGLLAIDPPAPLAAGRNSKPAKFMKKERAHG